MVTKIYRNDNKQPVVVPGIGEIPAGEAVSITSDYPPQVVLENFPGLVDVVAEEEAAQPSNPEEPVS